VEKIKLIYKQLIGLVFCISIYVLYKFDLINLGKLYNKYFYCGPDYATGPTAFPCYAWVDFLVIFLVFWLGIFFLIAILFKLSGKTLRK
jgi:hypothetical protein